MILVKNNYSIFKYTQKILYPDILLLDALKIVSYTYYLGKDNFISKLFIKSISTTILIDLNNSDDGLLNNMKSNTRNEIRKAIKEGSEFVNNVDVMEFVHYYNEFAIQKGLTQITEKSCKKYGDNLIITGVKKGDVFLSMHASVFDIEEQYAILLYSASKRLEDEYLSKIIGASNRYLHYRDFILLRNLNCNKYDLGGIYTGDSDIAQIGIANFKKSFGGEEKKRISYRSFLFSLLFMMFK